MSSQPVERTISERAAALADELCAACDDGVAVREVVHGFGELRQDPEGRRVVTECAEMLRRDGRFDLLWAAQQQALDDEAIHQVEDLDDGVSTLTRVRMEGIDPERVLEAMVEMPWEVWWRHGRVAGWRREEAGVEFRFRPVKYIPVRVGISIEPATLGTEEAGGLERSKIILRSRFTGNFVGPARFEILRLPDGCVLRAAWQKVQPGGWTRLLSRYRMAANHKASERGEMPFARGGGYLGLMRYLRRPGR